jgi:2-methylcitrate dehydratase PrpD
VTDPVHTHAEPSLLAHLAEFSHGIRLADVPPQVRRQAHLNILDTIGCIASGARLAESQQLLRAEASRGGPQEATVLGGGQRLPIEAAARVNGYMGDVFELNDLIGGHASIVTVTPALALAESVGASGAQLVEAVIAGIEVVCRVHGGFYAHQKPFTETAMVQVTIASAAGAAATAAKLLKLDAQQTMQAMAIAASLTSWGPAELVFGEGNSLKPILFGGWPGSMGLVGANYARNGITGPSRLLESPIGYYSTVARAHDRSVVLDFENWRLAQPRRKLHACCGYTHSAIDLVARMRAGGQLAGADRVRVFVPPYIIPAISKGGRPPATPNEARFNIEYCLALASVDTDVILPEHSMDCEEHLKRPDIAAAVRRFEVVADPAYNHYRFCRVQLLDEAGRVVREESYDAPRGSEWNPMSDDEVIGKFQRLAAPFMTGAQAESYIARVEQLASAPGTDWLLRAFA